MEMLRDDTQDLKTHRAQITVGRYVQCLARAKNDPAGAHTIADSHRDWLDRDVIKRALMAAVTPFETSDYPGALVPMADAFLTAMRSDSIPRRLIGLRRVPMLTRLFINAAGVVAAEVIEGAAIPALQGNWTTATLTPRKWAGIVVQTDELLKSESATASVVVADDLASATAEAENRAFCSPDAAGSVLYGAPSFGGTGAAVAQVDADLLRLVGLVPGAFRPGAAFVMTQETATFLSLLRGTGGAPAYPSITPQGGTLLGLPVLISSACQQVGSPPTRIVGLLSPSEIFWADESKVVLFTSNQAALKMDDAATATAGNTVSMWQTNATATRAVLESAWHARSGSGAYFVAGF
ncbi:MAG: phage major capsid protein [Betaproteobacteria bacterium]|nr:phage major capsid protein [Betaproteobacteria bacterium]